MTASPEPPENSGQTTATITKYRLRLLAFIRRKVRSDEEAEDLLQNVFYQFVKADALMRPIDQVSAWLYRVAKNQIVDHLRKKKESALPEYEDSENDNDEFDSDDLRDLLFNHSNTPEDQYARQLFWVALNKALAELPENQRVVFEKTELHGCTFKMLAEETGVPVNTLISRKRYAIIHLRKRLRPVYDALTD